jgi:uncharacterized Fe-S cluster protein YjdI
MKEYRGGKIIVRYDEKICIHAGDCVEGLPQVFDVNKRPWVNANGADAEAIKAQVARCPSGALTCEMVNPQE